MIFADIALVIGILLGMFGPKTWDLKPVFLVLIIVYAVAVLSGFVHHGEHKDTTV